MEYYGVTEKVVVEAEKEALKREKVAFEEKKVALERHLSEIKINIPTKKMSINRINHNSKATIHSADILTVPVFLMIACAL